MAISSPDTLTTPFQEAVIEHNCAYGERILRGIGLQGLTTYELSYLGEELNRLHDNGTCPPTHIDNSPTKEWSDWVRATKR